MSDTVKLRRSPNRYVCGALQYHPTLPVDLWYVCGLNVGHPGVHEAFGSDPVVTWKQEDEEVFERETGK